MSTDFQLDLFPHREMPPGFIYHPDFISAAEEQQLLAAIRQLEFSEVRMHGVVARRRTAHFGLNYSYETRQVRQGPLMPDFLSDLRERLRSVSLIEPSEFVEVLVSEYPTGAGIGWHRDAPAFGVVAGISLLGECRMRFRLQPSEGTPQQAVGKQGKPLEQVLAPRSAYVLQADARTRWQHHIPPTKSPRYSITFRTLR